MALIKDSIEISIFFLVVRPLKPSFLSNNLRKSETTKTKAAENKNNSKAKRLEFRDREENFPEIH